MVYPLQPSGAIGCLHSFAAERFGDRVAVHSYSAHWEVLYGCRSSALVRYYLDYRFLSEDLFFLVCSLADPPPGSTFLELLDRFNASVEPRIAAREADVESLRCALEDWVDTRLRPALDPSALNVVGFTTTFAQVFASIYAVRYLRRSYPELDLLFVFGGASVSVPETAATLERWHVEGLIVRGPGEPALAAILEACVAASDADEAVGAALSNAPGSVLAIGEAWEPFVPGDLGRGVLDGFPLPDYSEYFTTLARACDSRETFLAVVADNVALPFEGSRGCFAKCDFCQIPALTTRFRSRSGAAIAARVSALCDLYGKDEVVFADAVCNSWAEEYADALRESGRYVTAFMELRVHHAERFWAKLALSGVTEMQLGIEALSEPLLKAMNKGTTVLQNVRAAKVIRELGVRSLSNLITHHPKSTAADVAETERVVAALTHLPRFALSVFAVASGSPFHAELSEARRAELDSGFPWLPAELRPWSCLKDLSYVTPRDWLERQAREAWDAFHDWHASLGPEPRTFKVTRVADEELVFEDGRGGEVERFWLRGAQARLYDYLHAGSTTANAVRNVGIEQETVQRWLDDFVARGLVLRLGEQFLSLALRPREELVGRIEERLAPSLGAVL
jgi:magnesium-protoporphyrin IX monomethyl ester (oxidative) cyclase